MNKKWFEVIDFYRLTGITLIWISAWIFMLPWKTDVTSPYSDNAIGTFFALFGFSKTITVNAQQTPDLISAATALVIIAILQIRGIFSLTTDVSSLESKNHRALFVFLNVISIIVHTLFFSMLVKLFLFPDMAQSSMAVAVKNNLFLLISSVALIAGMIFGAQSLAKIFILLFLAVALVNNGRFVSNVMGIWGFVGITLSAIGFYLEFCINGFSKTKFQLDFAFLLGKYEQLHLEQNTNKTHEGLLHSAETALLNEKLLTSPQNRGELVDTNCRTTVHKSKKSEKKR